MKLGTMLPVFAVGLILMGGCTGLNPIIQPIPPVTYEEVIRLTQEKVAPEVIINKIHDSGTVFRLNSDEVSDLRRQGVDAKVVDYMMDTYTEQVRRDQELHDWNRWSFYGGHYYWWPDWDGYCDHIYGPRRIRP